VFYLSGGLNQDVGWRLSIIVELRNVVTRLGWVVVTVDRGWIPVRDRGPAAGNSRVTSRDAERWLGVWVLASMKELAGAGGHPRLVENERGQRRSGELEEGRYHGQIDDMWAREQKWGTGWVRSCCQRKHGRLPPCLQRSVLGHATSSIHDEGRRLRP